jgi:hypothetical protein
MVFKTTLTGHYEFQMKWVKNALFHAQGDICADL